MILYVYFKFVPADHPQVAQKVWNVQERLKKLFPDLGCRLLKRPKPDESGKETWMEVYELATADQPRFDEKLSQLVLEYDLPQPRFNEIFIPIE